MVVLSMADYYSILARAVWDLDRNTAAARRRLYERAHSALLSEMQNAFPRIARSEIMIAQMALDIAIGQVEAEAALVALEKSVEHVERDDAPMVPDTAIERVEEHGRPYQSPKPVAPASLIPTRMSKPSRLPANQNDRPESLFGIRKLFRWRSPRSAEISEEKDVRSDAWLTELLQRASREEDEDYQDFAPKHASNRNVYPGRYRGKSLRPAVDDEGL
jgi:hypothetical protein